MIIDKSGSDTRISCNDDNNTDVELRDTARFGGTEHDQNDMQTLGKTQQLNRNFRFLSILAFSCSAMSTWEFSLAASTFGLLNGGTAGLIWGYLFAWIGFLLVFASISEMASMLFSYLRWSVSLGLSVLGWQCGLASLAFIDGTVIQGLIVLNSSTYVYERWHGSLLVIAILSFSVFFNTFLAQRLPMVEGSILVLHIVGFFAIIIPLWVLAPRNSAKMVFTEFQNLGGWSSQGLSFMVGLLSPIYTLLGVDSAVHMSEETRDASLVLPRATFSAILINGFFGFVMIISFCFTLGSPTDILQTYTGYPFIQSFYDATGSYAGASIMVAIIITTVTSSCISTVATVSRQMWSFARDNAMPFSPMIAHVIPGWKIPLNSVLLTLLITSLLSLINIGSTVAFNAISSSSITSLLTTYIISITCVILRRIRGPALPPRRWSLGRFGLFVNIGSILFLVVIYIFVLFPISTPVTLQTMNWNCLIVGGTAIFAVFYYYGVGKKFYVGPVALVRRHT
ncbi:hypothetical protein DV736_g5158, partial [Chaetothyriales sp. CBS 134916]